MLIVLFISWKLFQIFSYNIEHLYFIFVIVFLASVFILISLSNRTSGNPLHQLIIRCLMLRVRRVAVGTCSLSNWLLIIRLLLLLLIWANFTQVELIYQRLLRRLLLLQLDRLLHCKSTWLEVIDMDQLLVVIVGLLPTFLRCEILTGRTYIISLLFLVIWYSIHGVVI